MNEVIGAIIGGLFTLYAVRYSFYLERKKRPGHQLGVATQTVAEVQPMRPSWWKAVLGTSLTVLLYYVSASIAMAIDASDGGSMTLIFVLCWTVYLAVSIVKNYAYYRRFTMIVYLLLFALSIVVLLLELL